ncbi:hypothetical protein [Herbaspirillum robiniae]|uniref:hypothetical protein n=1 Tax=Herbaspirillum robiniae TaxID=2014887 RepID=UPI003D786607
MQVDSTVRSRSVSPTLAASIHEAVRKQELQERTQRVDRAYAQEITSGKITLRDVPAGRQEAVAELLKTMRKNPRTLFMEQHREAKRMAIQHAKERAAAGMVSYRPRQEIFTAVLRTHLDGCESGEYPTAKATAEATVGTDAPRLLRNGHSKRQLRTGLKKNEGHPAMKLINGIADSSTITALVSGSVSSCLGALANSHKLAKRLERIEREQYRAQQREKELTARITSLEARRDLEDAGKNWKDEVARLRKEQPSISMRALGRAVGVSDTAIRKHLSAIGQ